MQVLNIFHVLIAIALVALILVQRGQGATAGAAFGSGASGTVFGSRGAGTFLTRSTWVLAALFCSISLTMAVVVSRTSNTTETDMGVIGSAPATQPAQDVSEPVEPTVSVQAPPDTDLPVLDTMNESQAVDDVPALDIISTEEAAGEEAPEESGGAAGSGS